MESNSTKKKTRGRRKIEMKKIESKKNLQVTFSKRRKGLFAKAAELGALCGSEIAILVRSPADKIFTFGNPSVESVVRKFECGACCTPLEGDNITDVTNGYFEAVARLDEQNRVESAVEIATGSSGMFWWDEKTEGMELHELEEYVEALEKLQERVKAKESLERVKAKESECQNTALNLEALIDYFVETSEEKDAGEGEWWHFDDDDIWGWKTSNALLI